MANPSDILDFLEEDINSNPTFRLQKLFLEAMMEESINDPRLLTYIQVQKLCIRCSVVCQITETQLEESLSEVESILKDFSKAIFKMFRAYDEMYHSLPKEEIIDQIARKISFTI